MQDSTNGDACAVESETCAQGSKGAHAHDESRTQKRYRIAQGIVTSGKKRLLFAKGKFVRRQIARRSLHKNERAVVRHEETREETRSRAEIIAGPAP